MSVYALTSVGADTAESFFAMGRAAVVNVSFPKTSSGLVESVYPVPGFLVAHCWLRP
jgi:hypothetical protein